MFEEILPELIRKTEEAIEAVARPSPITSKEANVAFVDGGQATIFESPEARVEYIRIYGTRYKGKERQETRKEEGSILVRRIVKEGEELIETRGYGLDCSFSVAADEPELCLGKEEVTLARVANLARFRLECRFLKSFDADILVRDGPLTANNAHEREALDALLSTGKLVAGLCKTNSLLEKGRSVTASLEREGCWLAPIKEERGVKIGAVKLHTKSNYAFRLDTGREKGDEAELVAGALIATSGDAAFPGYPYPLVEADRMARVSNKELETLRMRFIAEAGKEWKSLERLQRGSDAHSVLDSL